MNKKSVDYLILGSGLSALSFGALMAKKGHSVKIIEAHEFFGGYGHTFQEGDYKFNAHLHYVVGCGEGGVVNTVLKKLELDKTVLFTQLDPTGYDHAYCEEKLLKIPHTLDKLQDNMIELYPDARANIIKFIDLLKIFDKAAGKFPRHAKHSYKMLPVLPSVLKLLKYKEATLQQVFDEFMLPPILQTLVSGQLLDYLLPPKTLSFFVWAALFTAYSKGAYYPVKHFGFVIDSLVDTIRKHQGEVINNTKVTNFIMDNNQITGVETQAVDSKTGIPSGSKNVISGKTIICNFDPKHAAQMIGLDKFSHNIQKRLDYDYSGSSFVLYAVVKDLNLRDFGFGSWNIWHCQPDHNATFDRMLNEQDYSKPYFAMNSCSLHATNDHSNCPKENHQILQMLTVADYDYWAGLKIRDRHTYNSRKLEVFNQIFDIIEAQYVPNIRQHIVFKMTGSPTTNERYVLAPQGGAYGINLTPRNFELGRKLGANTSLKNFYFCCAASGAGGFSGSIMTGLSLYEKLSGDYLD